MNADRDLALIRQTRRTVQAEARAGKPRECDACGGPIPSREPVRVIVSDDTPVRVEHMHIDGKPRCRR